MERKLYAIILAGGRGERMGADRPKQFLELDGKPILRRTIEKFLSLDRKVEIIVVLPSVQKEYWKNYCKESGFLSRYIMSSGGITRFHSVKNALAYVPDGAIVAVHDGVRPLVTKEFLESLLDAAVDEPAIVPALPVVESVRRVGLEGSEPVDREGLMLVQTPQVFHSEIIKRAYELPYIKSFTDDASVVEASGCPVKTVPGQRFNIKITTPEDMKLAQMLSTSFFSKETV